MARTADQLGQTNTTRLGEVLGSGLCQVCGCTIAGSAYAVVRDPNKWGRRAFDGLLHPDCARLAFANCPVLNAWNQGWRLFRMAATDVTWNKDGQPEIAEDATEVTPASLSA